MAAGDVFVKGIEAIAQNSYFIIRPVSGQEVVIHNISRSIDASLEFFDGVNYVAIDTRIGPGGWMGMFLHCTYDKYYRVRNTNVNTNNICCDGMVTKQIV